MLNRLREWTGIYALGFNRDSVLGLLIPFAFVVLVGGLGIFLILFW